MASVRINKDQKNWPQVENGKEEAKPILPCPVRDQADACFAAKEKLWGRIHLKDFCSGRPIFQAESRQEWVPAREPSAGQCRDFSGTFPEVGEIQRDAQDKDLGVRGDEFC